MPADDLTDPAPATTFSHLDATTVLSRSIAELGIYPAVDPLDSTSRILDKHVVGEEHYTVARAVQKILQVGSKHHAHRPLNNKYDARRTTSPSRTLSPFSVWMSFLRMTRSLSPVPARSSGSFPSLSAYVLVFLMLARVS